MNKHTWILLGAFLASAFGCNVEGDADGGASNDADVSEEATNEAEQAIMNDVANRDAARMVQSTGNLYFTHNLSTYSAVFRTSKSATPGAETVLYSETGTGSTFGDITHALVGGTFYGYFIAKYGSTAQIKRIPLAGGAAVVLATSPGTVLSSYGSLKQDGASLFWSDSMGVHTMPIGGGSITTLTTEVGRDLGLDATRVYYSSGSTIRSVPKSGGSPITSATGGATITSLFVNAPAGGGTVLYWGDEDARVQAVALSGGGSPVTYQSATASRRTATVSFDGSRVLWGDCHDTMSGTCNMRKYAGGVTTTFASGLTGVANVQGDATAAFFTHINKVTREVH